MNDKEKAPLIREGGAYDDLASLYDPGTFVELYAYAGRTAYAGVVCGYGSVNGSLVFAFAQDLTRSNGAIGEDEASKIVSLYDMAQKSGAPVIGIFEGAGAKILEGAAALSAFGKVISKIGGVSGIIPQIAVIRGVCAGMCAVAASMFDVIIASKDASYFINPPSVMREKGDKEAGLISSASSNGSVDIVCVSAREALQKARELVSILPQNNAQGLAYSEAGDDLERLTPELECMTDTHDIINTIVDSGSFTEFKADCAKEVTLGLASVGTITTGIVATGGDMYLTPRAARKISEFISFCDNFMIPVLTIVDTMGIDRTVSSENGAYSSELARIALAYSGSGNAKVTLISGKAYGAAFTLLGSKAVGADVVFAMPRAKVSIMEPEAQVQFLYGEEIKSSADPVSKRKELLDGINKDILAARGACETADVDDVVSYELVRAKIISAFMMLWAKADGKVQKKHSKLPF